MAFPTDSARQGTNVTTASTTWNINVGSPAAGTLLIVLVRFAADPGAVTFTGYTAFAGPDTSDATDDTTVLYYRWADGTEGATDVLNPTNSVKGCAICWEITGAQNPGIQPPEASTVAVGTTTANTGNPDTVTPTGGAQDYLFLAVMGLAGELNAPTASPTNYSTVTTANSGTGGAVATNCSVAGGSRQLNASSENPGTFTHAAATGGWTAYTVAIHPAGPAVRSVSDTGATVSDSIASSAVIARAVPLLQTRTDQQAVMSRATR